MKKKHSTGSVRIFKNSYGNPVIHSIHSKGRNKSKPHIVVSNLSVQKPRKGTKVRKIGYTKSKYLGRKIRRR